MDNHIQTAGQQKYYDFIEERAKSIRTNMIVWISFLCVALICLFNNIIIALILAAIGCGLAVANVKAQRELKGKLDVVSDKEEFFCQLAAPDVVRAQEGHIIVTKGYVLVSKTDIFIYPLSGMEKVEVGIQGNNRKTLLLIDKQGKRYEIMSGVKKKKDSGEFDKVYEALKERVRI